MALSNCFAFANSSVSLFHNPHLVVGFQDHFESFLDLSGYNRFLSCLCTLWDNVSSGLFPSIFLLEQFSSLRSLTQHIAYCIVFDILLVALLCRYCVDCWT